MSTYHEDASATAVGDDQSAREKFDSHLRDAQARAAHAAEGAQDVVKSTLDDGTRFVRENPGVALAGALGLGVIIGLTLRGRG